MRKINREKGYSWTITCSTYEPYLFYQTIQTKYLRLCLLNVAFKNSNLKRKKLLGSPTEVNKQKAGRQNGVKKNTLLTSELDLMVHLQSYLGQKGAFKTMTKHVRSCKKHHAVYSYSSKTQRKNLQTSADLLKLRSCLTHDALLY